MRSRLLLEKVSAQVINLPTIIVANNNKNNHNKQKQTPVKSSFSLVEFRNLRKSPINKPAKVFLLVFFFKKTNVTAKCFRLDKNTNCEFIELY